MRYVYRDPDRLRGRPVHVPEDVPPEPEPEPIPLPAHPPPEPPAAVRAKPMPQKKKPRPLPTPVWGGPLGLELAAAESADLDRRTALLIQAGQTSEWVREYQRIHKPT